MPSEPPASPAILNYSAAPTGVSAVEYAEDGAITIAMPNNPGPMDWCVAIGGALVAAALVILPWSMVWLLSVVRQAGAPVPLAVQVAAMISTMMALVPLLLGAHVYCRISRFGRVPDVLRISHNGVEFERPFFTRMRRTVWPFARIGHITVQQPRVALSREATVILVIGAGVLVSPRFTFRVQDPSAVSRLAGAIAALGYPDERRALGEDTP